MSRKRILNDREWLLQTAWASIDAQNKRTKEARLRNNRNILKKQRLKTCIKACTITVFLVFLVGIVLVLLID
jgi:hypothetical protein